MICMCNAFQFCNFWNNISSKRKANFLDWEASSQIPRVKPPQKNQQGKTGKKTASRSKERKREARRTAPASSTCSKTRQASCRGRLQSGKAGSLIHAKHTARVRARGTARDHAAQPSSKPSPLRDRWRPRPQGRAAGSKGRPDSGPLPSGTAGPHAEPLAVCVQGTRGPVLGADTMGRGRPVCESGGPGKPGHPGADRGAPAALQP